MAKYPAYRSYTAAVLDKLLSGKLDSEINEDYSVLKDGKFINLFERTDGFNIEEVSVPYTDASYGGELQYAPICLNKTNEVLGNKYLQSFSYIPNSANKTTLEIGYMNITNLAGLSSRTQLGAKTPDEILFRINPNDEDYNKLTKFILDGTDSRVSIVAAPDATGYLKITDKQTLTMGTWVNGSLEENQFLYQSTGEPNVFGAFMTSGIDGTTFGENSRTIPMSFELLTPTVGNGDYLNADLKKFETDVESLDNRVEELENIEPPTIVNPFKGKKISFLGDSISTFAGETVRNINFYPNGDVQLVTDTYWKQLVDELEMELVANASISGGAITGDRGSVPGVLKDNTYLDLSQNGVDPEIIIVNIGTNDFNHIKPPLLGSYSGTTGLPDITMTEPWTVPFREGYMLMLMKIRTEFPTAKIYCSTMFTGDRFENSLPDFPQMNTTEANGQGDPVYYVTEYNQAIRDIATAMNCPIISLDMLNSNGMNVDNYTTDGTHPNKLGMTLIKERVKETMLYGSTTSGNIGLVTQRENEASKVVITINEKLPDENGNFANILEIAEQILTPEEQAIVKANLGIINTIIQYTQSTGNDTTIAMSQDAVTRELGKYVLAVDGLGLSAKSYTEADQIKLASLKNYDDTQVKADIVTLTTDKANKDDVYTKEQTDARLTAIYTPKGSVQTYADLPTEGNKTGDTYNVIDEGGLNYSYTADGEWDSLGAIIDLTGYAKLTDLPDTTSDLINNSNYVSDANYVHTDENFTTLLKQSVETIPDKSDKVVEITIANADAIAGVALKDNTEIIISDSLTGMKVTSATGSGMISFTAGVDLIFTLPGDSGWDGDAVPTFIEGLTYKVLYIDGTFFTTRGRTKL